MSRNPILGLATLAGLGLTMNGAMAQTVPGTSGAGVEATKTVNAGSYNQAIGASNANGSGVEYAVQDFTPAAPVSIKGTVNSLTLNLYNEGYSADAPGTVDFYLTTDTATTAASGGPLRFDTTTNANGVAVNNGTTITDGFAQGSSLYFLGTGAYTTQAADTLDAYRFTVSGAAATYLTNALSAGGDVRLVIAPDASTPTVYDSFFGTSVTSPSTPPSVTFTTAAAPEPSSVAGMVIGVGMVGLIAARRRFAAK